MNHPPRRPALLPAASLLTGLFLGPLLPDAAGGMLPAAAGLLAISLVVRRAHPATARAIVAVALLLSGAGLESLQRREYERLLATLFPAGSRARELHFTGELLGLPERNARGDRLLLLRGSPEESAGGGDAAGMHVVRLRVAASSAGTPRTDRLLPGDRLRVWCRLRPALPEPPGGRPRASVRPGHHAVGRVKNDRLVEPLGGAARGLGGIPARLRLFARARLDRTLGDADSSRPILLAMLLGDRGSVGPERRRLLRDAGMLHLVAISGLHVGILAALMVAAVRRSSLGRWSRSILLVLLLALYAPVVGGRPSVLRAALGASLVVLGRCAGREGDALNSLVLIAAGLGAGDPSSVRSPAFQLTFLATAGILLLARPIALGLALPRPIATALGMSLSAYLATAPAVAVHFGHLSPVGIVSNLAAAPLCASVLLTGYGAIALADLPWVGAAFGGASDLGVRALLQVAELSGSMPGGSFAVPRPSAPIVAACYALLARIPGATSAWRVTIARGGLCMLAAWLHLAGAPPSPGPSEVTAIDVGQGLAVAVRGPAGARLLVDAGGRAASSFDPGERIVVPHLVERGGRRLEALILSHEDIDHVGGAFAVLREMEVGQLWIGPGYHRSAPLRRLVGLAVARGSALVLVERGIEREVAGLPVRVLAPPRSAAWWSDNDRSVVVRIGREPCRLILPGDLGRKGERALVESGLPLEAEALVVTHHGSRHGSTPAFLSRVVPRWSVVSAGPGNPFGHPHGETLRRLREAGSTVLRTDRLGAVRLRAGPQGWSADDQAK